MALAITPSTYCRARCRHCFYSVKERTRDLYRRDLMLRLAAQIPKAIRLLSITGGEPFDRPRRLVELVGWFSANGRSTVVVTNGQWAADAARGRRLLRLLTERGLRGMTVSVDAYHRPRLILTQLKWLLEMAQEQGLAVRVQGVGSTSFDGLSQLTRQPDLRVRWSQVSLRQIGMASALPRDEVGEPRGTGCSAAMVPSVEPDGRVLACCSIRKQEIKDGPLLLGRLDDQSFEGMLDRAGTDYRLAAIALMGPAGLYDLLGDDEGAAWARIDACAACIALSNDAGRQRDLVRRLDMAKELRKEIAAGHLLSRSFGFESLFGWAVARQSRGARGRGR